MNQMLFGDPLKLNAVRYAEKEALSFQGNKYTYQEFNERVNKLSHALQNQGIQKGDKVAFMLFNCNQLVETIYACSKIGAIFVPINSRFIGREIQHVLQNSQAIILIYDYRFSEEVQKASKKATSVKIFITVHGEDNFGKLEYENWIASFETTEPKLDEVLNETDEICYLYTGGTTGLPKGAVHTHRSMYMVGLLFSIEFSIGRNGKGLVTGPLYGAAALSVAMPNLFVGNPLHILENFHPVEVLKAIDEEKTTTVFLAPPMLNAIFALPGEVKHAYDMSTMKTVISVGAPLLNKTKEQTIAFFPDAEINEFYGASEHGGSTNLFPEYMMEKDRSVGLPMLGMDVKLLDGDGKDVDQGSVGEIYVKGLTLCQGYFDNEKATKEAFRDGWLGLGDMATQDDEGFYYLVERKQDMILSGAINIYPTEMEEVLHEYPKVADAAVIGMPDEKWGEVPMAIIVAKPNETIKSDEILAFCTENMANYKVPHRVEFIEELPRNLQGKVLKYQLRETFDIK